MISYFVEFTSAPRQTTAVEEIDARISELIEYRKSVALAVHVLMDMAEAGLKEMDLVGEKLKTLEDAKVLLQ